MKMIKRVLTILILCFALSLTAQYDVIRTDGTVYKNITHLQDAEDFYLFEKDGKPYSLPKHRIRKITDRDGKTVFEQQDLKVHLIGDDINNYMFMYNGTEVGRGKWLGAGEFLVTAGDIPDGVYKEFHDTGELKRTFSIKEGTLNGVCKVFFRSGKVEREGFFKDGKEEGTSKLFYPKGELKGESYYSEGVKTGETKLYYESGKLKAQMRFKDGRPDGEQVTFYENGKMESKIFYTDGIKNGAVEFYYESGKLKLQGRYVDDMLDGTVTNYYESGRVRKRQTFSNGRILQ